MGPDKGMKFLIILFSLLIVFPYSAESYTVILKNGKVLKGKLLSETEDVLVFKDEQGLQYSLKKSVIDLQKTNEANEPPPEPDKEVPAPEEVESSEPVGSEQQETSTPQQGGESEASESVPAPEETMAPVSSTEAESSPYFISINEGTAKLENVFEEVGSYLDAMMTAWEVNASTGRDPVAAFREFKTNKGPALTASIDALFQDLEISKTKLNDPPVQYSTAFEAFNSGIGTLTEYYNAIRQYDGKPAISVFKSRLSPKEQSIQKKIEELKAVKP